MHHGIATVQRSGQGSVGLNQLAPQLKSFTTDVFTGNGSATQFTMSEAPTGGSEMVFVDGILQKSSTNYGVSGTTLTFTSAILLRGAEIEVKHLGLRTVVRRGTDFVLDNFTGDGSTTAFTLSQTVPVNSAFVFYNGVCMKPTTDYGISGVTLTFTFTPLNNSNIMVRYQG